MMMFVLRASSGFVSSTNASRLGQLFSLDVDNPPGTTVQRVGESVVLELSAAAHDLNKKTAPRLTMRVDNADFELEVRWGTPLPNASRANQVLGVFAESRDTVVRYDVRTTGFNHRVYGAVVTSDTSEIICRMPRKRGAPDRFKLARTAHSFSFATALPGRTYDVHVTSNVILPVRAVGVFVANSNGTPLQARLLAFHLRAVSRRRAANPFLIDDDGEERDDDGADEDGANFLEKLLKRVN